MGIAAAVFAVVFFSIMAFWRLNAVLFMLAGGSSIMLGLYWFDVYTNDMGLSISLMLFGFSFMCLGFAFKVLFFGREVKE